MKFTKGLVTVGLASLAALSITSCKKDEEKVYSNDGTHTYRQATSTFPNNFNPFTYETATANDLILAHTSSGLYEFDYNETKDSYKQVNAMATGDPVDVTSEYDGDETWGIQEGAKELAWEVTLRDDLAWSDGTKIDAQSFVDSFEILLNPKAQYSRADDYTYAGNFVIHNAKNYLYQGKTGGFAADIVETTYTTDLDSKLVFVLGYDENNTDRQASIRGAMGFPANYNAKTVAEYLVANYLKGEVTDAYGSDKGTVYKAMTEEEAVKAVETFGKMENKTLAAIKADAEMGALWARTIAWWQTMADEELDFFVIDNYTWPAVDFEDVGIKADGNKLTYIIDKPLSGFYLKYSMPASLVHTELYKASEKTTNGVVSSTYGTSVDTYASYGPYKLDYFEMDKEIRLVRNEHWYGYNDQKASEGYYQTDAIVTYSVKEDSTRLQMFLKGEIDSYGLTEKDMAEYQSSENTYYSESASTFFIAINPRGNDSNATLADKALSNLNFRQALSFAVDRKAFALACSPMNNAASSIFSGLIVSEPNLGKTYRNEEVAKDVVLNFWGLADQVGPGKRYETKDAAIDSITGVDVTQAKEKFNAAAKELKANGVWNGTDKLEIVIGMPSTIDFYTKGSETLQASWLEATKGTEFEGKLTFKEDSSIGDGFGDALRKGQVDLLFGVGWRGSELDPYGLIGAYIDPSQQYDNGINYSSVNLEIEFPEVVVKDETGKDVTLKDVTLTASASDYALDALSGNSIVVTNKVDGKKYTFVAGTSAAYDTRVRVLAACEAAVLEQYTMLPLLDDSAATLKGYKFNYATDNYVFGMGFGGMKYYTYNYDDAGWTEYVKDQGGTLNYK